jgi:phage-related baseplate assembly protein
MDDQNRFQAIATDPTARLLRFVASSLARSARLREAARAVEAAARCDASSGQCRILLDAAQREIDRLRRGTDCVQITSSQTSDKPFAPRIVEAPAVDSHATPPQQRKAYAVDPLGRWLQSPSHDAAPPFPAPPLGLLLLQITNLGTLLDVLV